MGHKNTNRKINTLPLADWEREAIAWCESRGLDFKVSNGGHHWQFRQGTWSADWWPGSRKLYVGDQKLSADTVRGVLEMIAGNMPEPPAPEEPPFDGDGDPTARVDSLESRLDTLELMPCLQSHLEDEPPGTVAHLNAELESANGVLRVGITRRDFDIQQLEAKLLARETEVRKLSVRYLALEKSAVARENELLETIKGLRSQLPESMQDCTIRFTKCEASHGRLLDAAWLPTDCPFCKINRMQTNFRMLRARKDEEIAGLKEQVDDARHGTELAESEIAGRDHEIEKLKAALAARKAPPEDEFQRCRDCAKFKTNDCPRWRDGAGCVTKWHWKCEVCPEASRVKCDANPCRMFKQRPPKEVPDALPKAIWTCDPDGRACCGELACRFATHVFIGSPRCPWGTHDGSNWKHTGIETVPDAHAESPARETDGVPNTAHATYIAISDLAELVMASADGREKFVTRMRNVLRCFEAGLPPAEKEETARETDGVDWGTGGPLASEWVDHVKIQYCFTDAAVAAMQDDPDLAEKVRAVGHELWADVPRHVALVGEAFGDQTGGEGGEWMPSDALSNAIANLCELAPEHLRCTYASRIIETHRALAGQIKMEVRHDD